MIGESGATARATPTRGPTMRPFYVLARAELV
jgi:hypothetical protein